MRPALLVAALFAAVVACMACDAFGPPPPTGPGTDYPCGVGGVVCTGPDGAVNGMCCDPDNTCGGGQFSVGCPSGMCCYIGPGSFAAKRAPTPQRKASP